MKHPLPKLFLVHLSWLTLIAIARQSFGLAQDRPFDAAQDRPNIILIYVDDMGDRRCFLLDWFARSEESEIVMQEQ